MGLRIANNFFASLAIWATKLLLNLTERGRTVCMNSSENYLRKLVLLGWVVFGVIFLPLISKENQISFLRNLLSVKFLTQIQMENRQTWGLGWRIFPKDCKFNSFRTDGRLNFTRRS